MCARVCGIGGGVGAPPLPLPLPTPIWGIVLPLRGEALTKMRVLRTTGKSSLMDSPLAKLPLGGRGISWRGRGGGDFSPLLLFSCEEPHPRGGVESSLEKVIFTPFQLGFVWVGWGGRRAGGHGFLKHGMGRGYNFPSFPPNLDLTPQVGGEKRPL